MYIYILVFVCVHIRICTCTFNVESVHTSIYMYIDRGICVHVTHLSG